MTRKVNIPSSGRDIYFAEAGDTDVSGLSPENPLRLAVEGAQIVKDLVPAVSKTDRSSLNSLQLSISLQGLDIPPWTATTAPISTITTTDIPSMTLGGNQTILWADIFNHAPNGVCVEIDGKEDIRCIFEVLGGGERSVGGVAEPGAINGDALKISGACEEISIVVGRFELPAEGWIAINHTASSTISAFEYRVGLVELDGDNTTFLDFNPPNASDKATIVASSIVKGSGASGTVGYNIDKGSVTVQGSILDVDDAIDVANGASLNISYQAVTGDITIDVGGTLEAIILKYTGTITNNGTINGIINGRRYGNWINNNYDENNTPATTTSTTPQLIHTFNFSVPHEGEYMIDAEFDWFSEKKDKSHITSVDLDTGTIFDFEQYMGGEDDNTDTNIPSSKRRRFTLTSGAHTLEMFLSSGEAGKEVTINDSTFLVEFWEN